MRKACLYANAKVHPSIRNYLTPPLVCFPCLSTPVASECKMQTHDQAPVGGLGNCEVGKQKCNSLSFPYSGVFVFVDCHDASQDQITTCSYYQIVLNTFLFSPFSFSFPLSRPVPSLFPLPHLPHHQPCVSPLLPLSPPSSPSPPPRSSTPSTPSSPTVPALTNAWL